ncbi:protease pro-enzyme activation domain-containing protein [Streptacidiphilus sp. N1-12]|uniref:Protease pro-enzyme activation domain-containing protein n=2 Tax=Streptacidiphilus alkalitolerans TaxID=3342712 RepID=A0ABV6V899_9ACTN
MALATGALALAVPSQAAPVAAKAKVLAGTRPAWATASADQGAVAANAVTSATVYLNGQDPAALAAYAKAVSSPGNASYGKFLTAAQAKAKFLATPAQIKAVQDWLTGAGLKIGSTTEHAITVSGNTAAIKRAFGTSLHQYKLKGKTVHAPTANAVIPAAVASDVIGVVGLATVTPAAKPQSISVNTAAQGAGAKPSKTGLPTVATCSDYWGQKAAKGAPYGYVAKTSFDQCSFYPSQLRKAYGITASGLTGKGATVAIIDAFGSSTMEADANQYSTNHGDKAFKPGQYSEIVTPDQWNNVDACGGAAGWAPEEALDVEMVHGLAPDAKVVYVGANSCTDDDLGAALANVVDNHLADVVSNSWGEIMHSSVNGDYPPELIAAYEQIFQQGAIEGIGFDFSAGDCGDSSPGAAATGANCDPTTTEAQANWPDSSQWVTSVGGTALAISSKKGDYGFETDMGTLRSALTADQKGWSPLPGAFYFGGGGGVSQDFAQPWYQGPVVPSALAHTLQTGVHSDTAQRVTPDISMNGDLYTSVLVGISDGAAYSEGGYGGTSVSAPEFSAVQADAIQAHGGRPLGFANPAIYSRAGGKSYTDVVNESAVKGQPPLSAVFDAGIVDGTLRARLIAFGRDYGLTAVKGYDSATGVGSPTETYLKSFKNG